MLVRVSQSERKPKAAGTGKNVKSAVSKMGNTAENTSVVGRTSRKVLRMCPAKRSPAVAPLTRAASSGKTPCPVPRTPPDGHDDSAMDPCDNSNDSGLGLEHTTQFVTISQNSLASLDTAMDNSRDIDDLQPSVKRARIAIKAEKKESDEFDKKFGFSVPLRQRNYTSAIPPVPLLPLAGPVCATTKDGQVTLSITSQPEQQHRARYQTEGSRGAVKDRNGQGFPVVKLFGYDKPARLQVFIGSDMDRVSPHMFYQACRVCGKNSTPCTEQKVEGTVVIELSFDPMKKMVVTCDCVGILKERNVDVEHRFPDETVPRSKKKSTRCRMVFRTCVERPDGTWETLQVVSQAIACTQLPGIPEICKWSLNSSPCSGGAELFLLGKNFLKDSRVVFQQPVSSSGTNSDKSSYVWEEEVIPDKEYLQPTHLVCVVPPFHRQDLTEPVSVRLFVRSSGKCSESQSFLYLPNYNVPVTPVVTSKSLNVQPSSSQTSVSAVPLPSVVEHDIANKITAQLEEPMVLPLIVPSLLTSQVKKMNPVANVLMLGNQAASQGLRKISSSTSFTSKEHSGITQQQLLEILKQKLSVTPTSTDTALCPIEGLLHQFVSENTGSPLPAQSGSSVEKFLSKIEGNDNKVENKAKSTKHDTYVSSTSLEYRGVDSISTCENLSLQSNLTLEMTTDSSTLNVPEETLKKKRLNKTIEPETLLTHANDALHITMKPSNINFINSTTISIPEPISTAVTRSSSILVTQEVLDQVVITPDSTVSGLENDNSIELTGQQTLITLVDQSPLLSTSVMHEEIVAPSVPFQSDPSTQLLNENLVQPVLQHLVDEPSIVNSGTTILSTQSSPSFVLINESLTAQFKEAESSLISSSNSAVEIGVPIISTNINQSQGSMIGHEIESEAHLINTQLGQLLTTDLMPEGNPTVGGPLVRDVLLGSGASVPTVLHHPSTLNLNGEVENKKADSLLSQDLTHMSDRDLLSYINTNCFDQVMP